MAHASCSDDEFVRLFEKLGPSGVAKHFGIAIRAVFLRRRNIENLRGMTINSPFGPGGKLLTPVERERRIEFKINDGILLVGSDAHYWPEIITPAHRAFVYFADWLKPKAIALNGDVMDNVKNSRHDPIGWAKGPTINQELAACDERTSEIRSAAPDGTDFFWLYGNHCIRFDSALAKRVAEYEGVKGMTLREHFPHWKFAYSLHINGDVVIKHRYKGGVHATHNNTVNSGRSIVTGHLHSLKVTPFDDYNGTRWGVDSGTLSQPNGEHADYTEDNPLNHRSGFVVLTFKNGRLLWPEIVNVVDDGHVCFRGQLIKV